MPPKREPLPSGRQFQLNNVKVETQDTLKILGVLLDIKLTLKAHIKEQLTKTDRRLLVWHQNFSIPLPAPLGLLDQNAAEKWKKFHLAWTSYSLATELNKGSRTSRSIERVTTS